MDRERFKISVITLIPEKNNSRFDDFKELGINIYQLSAYRKLSLVALLRALKRQVALLSPDCLHAHCARSLYLMCFLPRRYKRIYTIHIYPGYQHIQILGPVKGRIITFLNNFFTKKCDLPIGCSKSVGSLYYTHKGWSIKCIPNGTSTPAQTISYKDKEKMRQSLGLKVDVIYFIFVGRFSKEKNPDILIDVFNSVSDEKFGLIMLGDGPMWNDLKDKAGEKVIMPGFTTRVYDYLQAADYYISLSDVEGLANTLLESMSIGLPMVLSNIPSHNEVMENFEEGEVGRIINQHNISEVIEAMRDVQKMDRQNASIKIREIYKRTYTAQVMSDSYQREYLSIINN